MWIYLFYCVSLFTSLFIHAESQSIQTERFCVLYDAGETAALVPVLKKWKEEGKEFKVLVLGTAATLVRREDFAENLLTLKDLGVEDEITPQTSRTTPLSVNALEKLKTIQASKVLVGTASRIQEQVLQIFSHAETFAFVDNFSYEQNESFQTVQKVQAAAKHVLCPSINTVKLFAQEQDLHRFHVVGKPTIEQWEQSIANVDRAAALFRIGFTEQSGPIITFIGGYGHEYEVINPLYQEYAEKLTKVGYRVIIQPHPKIAQPKISTIAALAISDYIVGFNSSVIFDAAFFKNALYFSPRSLPFDHFAIRQGLIMQVHTLDQLVQYIREGKRPADLRKSLSIPKNSIELICLLIN